MLVFTRKQGQRIFIGTGVNRVIIEVLHVRENEPVKMRVDAPFEIKIGRNKKIRMK